MLRLRLIFGFSLAGLIIGLMLADGWLATRQPPDCTLPGTGLRLGQFVFNGAICTLVVVVFAWLAARELVGLARAGGHRPLGGLAQAGAIGLVLVPFVVTNAAGAVRQSDDGWALLLLAIVVMLAFFLQAMRYRVDKVLANVTSTVFIVLYIGGLGYFMTRLRMQVGGSESIAVLLFSIFVVKMTDTGAYVTGRLCGRHKLIEWLSPKKTKEGLAGGVVIAVLCALGVGHWLHASGIVPMDNAIVPYPWVLVVFGLVMAGFSAAGDLCASLLKRDAAMKDSGVALPGLGGILDVLDSPLLAAPAAWFFWTHVVLVGSAGTP